MLSATLPPVLSVKVTCAVDPSAMFFTGSVKLTCGTTVGCTFVASAFGNVRLVMTAGGSSGRLSRVVPPGATARRMNVPVTGLPTGGCAVAVITYVPACGGTNASGRNQSPAWPSGVTVYGVCWMLTLVTFGF